MNVNVLCHKATKRGCYTFLYKTNIFNISYGEEQKIKVRNNKWEVLKVNYTHGCEYQNHLKNFK